MTEEIKDFFDKNLEAKAFDLFRRGKRIPFKWMLYLGMRSIIRDVFLWFVRGLPGPIGIKIRTIYYKTKLRKLGRNSIIDEGTRIEGAENISIADFVWIDKNVQLTALVGEITIGKRVHIAPYSLISGVGKVFVGDYVGISSGVKIYSHSETSRGGKRMSGPMVPEEMKNMVTKSVIIEKDAFLGTNAVILPGVIIGEGAVVAANSLVTKHVNPYTIVMGVPAKPVGMRKPVSVPDI